MASDTTAYTVTGYPSHIRYHNMEGETSDVLTYSVFEPSEQRALYHLSNRLVGKILLGEENQEYLEVACTEEEVAALSATPSYVYRRGQWFASSYIFPLANISELKAEI